MEFVHRPYKKGETIAAVATPPGEGGIAVIRISGNEALDVAAKVFSGPVHSYVSHTVHFGKILNAQGNKVDEVLLVVMKGPRSYTGEDTVEIQCHGGNLITRMVLQTVLDAGARPASPGEFTFKAFMNGKIDLPQAEAVAQLIHAKNSLSLAAASDHLEGLFSKKIKTLQKKLFAIAAILEAYVDFPEEGLEFASEEEVVADLENVRRSIEALVATFHDGKMLFEGLSLCLIGLPNVGKSSLMNALLGKERAIVTDIPGTTRDLIEEQLKIGQLHFKLIDTAGIRNTDEVIEKEGIRRSKSASEKADIILYLLDVEKGITKEDVALIETLPKEKTIFVWNKIDLSHASLPVLENSVLLSAKSGEGLEELKKMIYTLIHRNHSLSKEEVVLSNERHYRALCNTLPPLEQLILGLKAGVSPEFLASDMRCILFELGTIIGTNISEEILSSIFSQFCVGK